MRQLELFGTAVTEAGLVHLRGLSKLRSLDLPIYLSRESLPRLVEGLGAIPRLEQVGLAGPYWEPESGEPEEPPEETDALWARLRSALPKTRFGVRLI